MSNPRILDVWEAEPGLYYRVRIDDEGATLFERQDYRGPGGFRIENANWQPVCWTNDDALGCLLARTYQAIVELREKLGRGYA